VTPGVEAHTHEFVRTGQEDTKFGFSVATGDARRAIDELREIPGPVPARRARAHRLAGLRTDRLRESLTILANFIAADDFDELCVGGRTGRRVRRGRVGAVDHEWGDAIRASGHEVGLRLQRALLAEPGRAIVAQAGRDAL
jgi:diaminopimelate decarboxylase